MWCPQPKRVVEPLHFLKMVVVSVERIHNARCWPTLMIARMKGNSSSSMTVGGRSLPTILSSSSCACSCVSGWHEMVIANALTTDVTYHRSFNTSFAYHLQVSAPTEANPGTMKAAQSIMMSSQSWFSLPLFSSKDFAKQSGKNSPAWSCSSISLKMPPMILTTLSWRLWALAVLGLGRYRRNGTKSTAFDIGPVLSLHLSQCLTFRMWWITVWLTQNPRSSRVFHCTWLDRGFPRLHRKPLSRYCLQRNDLSHGWAQWRQKVG